jgi:Uma2 family endonuclease
MSAVTELCIPTLGLESAGMYLTPEEFDAVTDCDEQYGYELIHGVLIVRAIPSDADANANEELGCWLRTYQDQDSQGTALDATLPERYVRTADSRRRADRVIWAGLGRMPNPKVDVPTIVVDFVSPGRRSWRRDYEEKRGEYVAIGVREYWIIDRFARSMKVYRPPTPGPAEQTIATDAVYRTDLLPGFELSLAKLLDAADAWEQWEP